MIEVHYSNMIEKVIGPNGIPIDLIDRINSSTQMAHRQITERGNPGLGFIDLVSQNTAQIKKTAQYIKKKSKIFLILGIGGSALGPRAILDALSPFHNMQKRPLIFIYDNVDPVTLKEILKIIDLRKTTVNVISKSGSTAETAASFMVLWEKMRKNTGRESSKRFVITTDPEKGNLRKIINENGFLSLSIPQGVGGRYSVLSAVGLLLAEVVGIDSKKLLKGAKDILKKCSHHDVWKNPAYLFGTLLYLMEREKKRSINVMIPYADNLKSFSEWFCQLWAESLGKENKGLTPYPSLGATDQHSQLQLWIEGPQDKVLIFIRIKDYRANIRIPRVFNAIEGFSYLTGHSLSELIKAEGEATEIALAKAGRPNMSIVVPKIDAHHLGQLFCFLEIATAFTGFLYGIDPFNQPGVEAGKHLTFGMMGRKGFEQKRKEVEDYRRKIRGKFSLR